MTAKRQRVDSGRSEPRQRRRLQRLQSLPVDLCAHCVSYLQPDELLVCEVVSRSFRQVVTSQQLWKEAFALHARANDWRIPAADPASYKRFLFRYRRERRLSVEERIPLSNAELLWRLPLPHGTQPHRARSRRFEFSQDGLGGPIGWQVEVELQGGVDAPGPPCTRPYLPAPAATIGVAVASTGTQPPAAPSPPAAAIAAAALAAAASGSPVQFYHDVPTVPLPPPTEVAAAVKQPPQCGQCQHVHQKGTVRIWTTNSWTSETTKHYYGSHCTVCLRDPLNERDLLEEVQVDIDSCQPLEFTLCSRAPRELLLRVNLTLALEVAAPLNPFYDRIRNDSDVAKVGYCRAIFEVARCKRKHGGTFVRKCDRNVHTLIHLAAQEGTSGVLRVEVFQALFNLLGPTSLTLEPHLASELLGTCFASLAQSPVPAPVLSSRHCGPQLAQNALGAVFNLLVHPLSRAEATPDRLAHVMKLLDDDAYSLCRFSAITVLLTALSWGTLPQAMADRLESETEAFISSSDPLNTDCTGVSWDESDIAGYFIPLLRARHLLCVRFSLWCMTRFYFPAPAHRGALRPALVFHPQSR